jgi:integrase
MTRRLPEGVRKLPNGRYQARYPVTVNGRTQQRSAGTFATVADAKDARAVAIASRKTGTWVDPASQRMKTEMWVQRWVSLQQRPLSHAGESFLRHHILPAFGRTPLGEITPLDVQQWVHDLTRSKGLAPVSARSVYRLLQRIMVAAVDFDVLVKTPCRAITLPEVESVKREGLAVQQVRALERSIVPRLSAMVHLAAWCGLRWQECAALRWENVDLAAGVIHVREAVKARSRRAGTTKNRKERLVPMSPITVAVLTAHRRDYGGAELVFPNTRGELQCYSVFRRNMWRPAVERSGVDATFHKLRHFYATVMVAEGIDPKVLSDAMGHHAPSFTIDAYGVARHDSQDVLRAALERAQKEKS